MLRDTSEECNFNVEKIKEQNVYKESRDSSKKTIRLVQVSVVAIFSLSLGSKSSNRGLDAVISSKLLNKVNRLKASVSIKIIIFSCPDILFYNKRLEADVNNNILNKLEEKEKAVIAICHDQYSLSLSENTIYKGDRSIGSAKKDELIC